MQSSPKASCFMTVRDSFTSHFLWPLWQNCSQKYEQNIDHYLALVWFPDFGLQGITGLLSISQQHGSIGLVEDGIVHRCITNSQRSLHYNDLHIKSSCLKQQSTATTLPQINATQNQPPHIKEEKPLTKTECSQLWNCISNYMQMNWYPAQFQKHFVVEINVIFQIKRLWTLHMHLLYSK